LNELSEPELESKPESKPEPKAKPAPGSEPEQRARVFLEGDLPAPEVHALPNGVAVVYTIPRNREEAENQDAAAIILVGASDTLLVVADGMGGTRRGAEAAATVVKHLAEAFTEGDDGIRMRTAILDAIEAANAHILDSIPDGGTTLAAVGVSGATIRPYHIGDSTILVTGQRRKLKLNTVSHDEDEALHHASRHIVSNAVGLGNMRIELGAPLELAPRDTLLLASDGLTDNLFLEEIIEILRKGPLDKAVASLAALARERMSASHGETPAKPDDLTMIAYRRHV